MTMHIIARVRSEFPEKFGIPRQSGLADTTAQIVFEPPYRNADALRGIEGFSHLWLIWQFSGTERQGWSPTVRPPKLGGNRRMGVFATRSPFRPNPVGLSSVRLMNIQWHTPEGPVLQIAGADLMDGTPVLDIKPYLAYTDSHPEATGGFSVPAGRNRLQVVCPAEYLTLLPESRRQAFLDILALDPRPGYQQDPERVYGFSFAGYEIRFTVAQEVLTVRSVKNRLSDKKRSVQLLSDTDKKQKK